MLDFRPITMEDRPWIHELLYAAGRRGCEYSFVTLLNWFRFYGGVARVNDFVCQEMTYRGKTSYLYPAGVGDIRPVLEALREDAAQRDGPFVLRVTGEDRPQLEALYPGKFSFTANRDAFDYTYPIEQMTDLTGKKLQSKRNHINRFLAEYPQWQTKELTDETAPYFREFAGWWYEHHDQSRSLTTERSAIETALEHYRELEMDGLILCDGERVVAFTIGNRIGRETFDVNFEKADPDVQGAYPMINRQFARLIREKYPEVAWLNREDDMGLEGLRRSKESYHPVFLEKYTAVWEG